MCSPPSTAGWRPSTRPATTPSSSAESASFTSPTTIPAPSSSTAAGTGASRPSAGRGPSTPVIPVLLRGLIGVVFLVSGTLKLRQPAWASAAAAFGAPRPVIPVVPWVEIVLGALLVAQVGGRWTPLAALAL